MAHILQAMLNAELADNDGWQLLIELAGELGYSDLEEQFQQALEEEAEHLENVRGWLSSMTLTEAMGESALLEGASVDGEKEEKEHKQGTQKQKGRARKKKTKGSRESKSKKR
jgi:rubrerythrin